MATGKATLQFKTPPPPPRGPCETPARPQKRRLGRSGSGTPAPASGGDAAATFPASALQSGGGNEGDETPAPRHRDSPKPPPCPKKRGRTGSNASGNFTTTRVSGRLRYDANMTDDEFAKLCAARDAAAEAERKKAEEQDAEDPWAGYRRSNK